MKGSKKTKSEVDISSYHLVPKMEILSEDAKKRVLHKYGITTEQLPRFKHNDPAVKMLGAKPGDVIKIAREDLTAKYNSYRVVVPR